MASADADSAELSDALRRQGIEEDSDSETASDNSGSEGEAAGAVAASSGESDSDEDDAETSDGDERASRGGQEEAVGNGTDDREQDATLQALKASLQAGNAHAANGNAGEDEAELSDEEDDDVEEEPSLKYQRLGPASTEILVKDTASALAVASRFIALGTHNGMVHMLSYEGNKISSFRPHAASVNDIKIDEDGDFVATASVEGRIVIHSLNSPENYAFDMKRPMKAVALEPGFAKSSSKTFVCGGMAGTLVMHEKGWLGHKEHVLHSGEGPIYAIEWRGNLIAWANDVGVKIYDTNSNQRITYIDRPGGSPRADLFKCNLLWQDDRTLLIAWADYIKVARIRDRSKTQTATGLPAVTAEITAIFQVDCMISGICPYEKENSYLVLAYVAPDQYDNEDTNDPMEQKRKAANRPELRIISKQGEEVSSDALNVNNYHLYSCNDYVLAPSGRAKDELFLVVSPKDVVVARPRDAADHINWLVEQRRFSEALEAGERLVAQHGAGLDIRAIGLKYIQHLVDEGSYDQAAALAPKVFGQDDKLWEDWIFTFVQRQQLSAIIPYIPTKKPRLSRLVYEMTLAHFLATDPERLLVTIKDWPHDIYDINAVLLAVKSECEVANPPPVLMECLAELYVANGQPSKALPFLLRLRKPDVFAFIREFNLFSAVQDQVLLLVDFDRETSSSEEKSVRPGDVVQASYDDKLEGQSTKRHGEAIALLVDHIYSIPVARVVTQLEERQQYLYMYLDALFSKDPHLATEYSDLQVELYAKYGHERLMDFLRASNYYSLERAFRICKERDFVPEMVFLLGRMGNNKQALNLIIERLGDVERAIDFAKEQADEDLWEDLLQYSETRPRFIRGLLENVGAEINPLRVIKRIKNGLEIPGLREALIKVLQASNLQVSLLQGCQRILLGDGNTLARQLQDRQTNGAYGTAGSVCGVCDLPLFRPAEKEVPPVVLAYFCGHAVHAQCALPDPTIELPDRPDTLANFLFTSMMAGSNGFAGVKQSQMSKALGVKLAYAATVRVRVRGCPICHRQSGKGN